MAQMNEQRDVWYFSPAEGWVHQREPHDRKYRLTAVGRTSSYIQVENKLEVSNPRGGWNEVDGGVEARMPAIERGYVFQIKPLHTENGSFVEVVSKRYLDEELLAGLFEGFSLFNHHGEPLANPMLAFGRFCLPRVQQDVFVERVRTIGGRIVEADADIHAMYETLQKLQQIYTEMEQICQMSRSIIDRVSEGIQSDAPMISERSRTAHHLRDQAAEMVDFIRSEKMALDQQPGQIEHRGYGGAYLENAEAWLSHVEKLHREHKSYEIQAVSRIKEAISQSLPSVDAPSSTRRYLFIPVVEYYTEQGLDCRLTADGMMLRVGDVSIELSEQPKVSGQTAVVRPQTHAATERVNRQL